MLPLTSIPPEIQSRDAGVPCPSTWLAILPTDRSLAIPLSLAQSASQFQTRLFQSAVDPFTDHIVCRVTKISPARVARGLQSTNKPVSSLGPLERVCPDCIVYIDQSKSTGNVFTNSKIKIAFKLLHGSGVNIESSLLFWSPNSRKCFFFFLTILKWWLHRWNGRHGITYYKLNNYLTSLLSDHIFVGC